MTYNSVFLWTDGEKKNTTLQFFESVIDEMPLDLECQRDNYFLFSLWRQRHWWGNNCLSLKKTTKKNIKLTITFLSLVETQNFFWNKCRFRLRGSTAVQDPGAWAVSIETIRYSKERINNNVSFTLRPELLSLLCGYTKIMRGF